MREINRTEPTEGWRAGLSPRHIGRRQMLRQPRDPMARHTFPCPLTTCRDDGHGTRLILVAYLTHA